MAGKWRRTNREKHHAEDCAQVGILYWLMGATKSCGGPCIAGLARSLKRMNEMPSGTLFIRRGEASYSGRSATTLLSLYGLVELRQGIEGERLYPLALERLEGGLSFRIDAGRGEAVPSQWATDGETLAGLARGQYWRGPDLLRGSGVIFLRRSGVPSEAAGKELYLVVSVLAYAEGLGLPNEHLMDFVAGQMVGMEPVKAVGATPDQVLQKPFFRRPDGSRAAVRSTVGPKTREALGHINRIFSMPEDERTAQDVERIVGLRQHPDHRHFLRNYEGDGEEARKFRAFVREMRAHALAMDRLISADELAVHDRAAAAAIRAVLESA